MNIQNLSSYDPFADLGDESKPDATSQAAKKQQTQERYVHIRIQQRNGRKTLTTLQGLPKEYDQKKLLKAFKKEFACNGTIVDDEELGQVIQLQAISVRRSPLLSFRRASPPRPTSRCTVSKRSQGGCRQISQPVLA